MLFAWVRAFNIKFYPYPADHDYCRFISFLFVDKIAVIWYEMCV